MEVLEMGHGRAGALNQLLLLSLDMVHNQHPHHGQVGDLDLHPHHSQAGDQTQVLAQATVTAHDQVGERIQAMDHNRVGDPIQAGDLGTITDRARAGCHNLTQSGVTTAPGGAGSIRFS